MMARKDAAASARRREDDDETVVVVAALPQRPDEIFERMHPPLHVTNVIVHENGTMIAPTSSTTTWLEKARTRTGITREECHATKTWHRSAHVWVFDKERNKVVLQKRSETKDTFAGMWDLSLIHI